ncbi:hypothetical protein EXU57_17550 [Segetibacter sp. 3557_3]|uniref:2'-5' RNA ligase family protein n=1 Tax=Segetibacter sp. 3557_3 TaxID=2547429 RepID=UPI001058A54D|nr:2'-5' RNA ligase family protein [Segetibacter sp. 3557_3]TDH23279.1 hypothetical protein EXU57_17550 [Segetibacter sp. 3557_3]
MEALHKDCPTIVPEEKLSDYLLVATASKELAERITRGNEDLYTRYGHTAQLTLKPHIAIARFAAKEEMEDTLIRYIQRVCCTQEKFTVTLNNYSGFPPDRIFLRIQDPYPLHQLGKALGVINEYISSCSCPDLQLIQNVHITTARNLPGNTFLKAMLDYSQRTFHEEFEVQELVLLRKTNGIPPIKTVNIFYLNNQLKNNN